MTEGATGADSSQQNPPVVPPNPPTSQKPGNPGNQGNGNGPKVQGDKGSCDCGLVKKMKDNKPVTAVVIALGLAGIIGAGVLIYKNREAIQNKLFKKDNKAADKNDKVKGKRPHGKKARKEAKKEARRKTTDKTDAVAKKPVEAEEKKA